MVFGSIKIGKRNIKRIILELSILSVFFIIFIGLVGATPQGPNSLNISETGRSPANTAAITVQAQAGNVTALVIDGSKITQAWQGYYGNITGTITLDDALNFTIYDWSLPNPTGEVYASNTTSVTWANVYCINVSQNGSLPVRPDGSVSSINGSRIELLYGINVTDKDGLNETFNDTYSSSTGFKVGETTINIADGCSSTHPYVNESYSTDWHELLLSDNNSLIFTAIIRDNADGYQPSSNDLHDFQMLVLENGHSGSDTSSTPYYFFVELA